MFRMWCKVFKENRLLKDIVIEQPDLTKNRTRKVLDSLDEACQFFDLSVPIWLELNIKNFKRHDKVKFYQDSFIETIEFDYLEIHVIEED